MDSSPLLPPNRASFGAGSRTLAGLVIAGFLLYALFLTHYMGAYGGGSDTSGYLNNARLLSQGTTHMPQRLIPGFDAKKVDSFAFIPLGFRPVSETGMAPTYPIGLPLVIAAVAQLVGWDAAPHLTVGIFAIGGLVLTAALGRCAGLPWSWSWFGALLVGASPLYSFLSLQLMSDVPATGFAVLTIIGAWRSREQALWAILAGAAMAGGVLTRPSNLVMIIPAALCLGLSWQRWLGFIFGGLPGAALQCYYNWHAYGHPLESGYGGSGYLFRLTNIPASLRNYAQWLPVLLTPVGVLAVALPWIHFRQRFAWTLSLWIIALLAFYVSYFHTHETWWYLRFVLPAFPACIVGGLWTIRTWWLRRPSTPMLRSSRRLIWTTVLVIAVLAQSVMWHGQLDAAQIGRGEAKYPETVAWLREHLPADATIAAMQCSGALVCYSDFTFFRWDIGRRDQASSIAHASLAAGRPVYAVLWPFEVKEATEVRLPGRWTHEGSVHDVTILKWAPP